MEVRDIIEQVDIVEYIKQFCELEEKNGEWWGLSPFKEEKTPSFSVNSEKRNFYDFSSGIGGNIITFIEKYNKCDFFAALEILKKYAGVSGEVNVTPRLTCTKIAKRFSKRAQKHKEIKYSAIPDNYMERYEDNRGKLKVWADEGISYEVMKKFCVRYDAFSDRIVYPVRDYEGNIINVCGRTLDSNYKEKKLPKYIYFKPLGCLDTLYGFSENREAILDKKEIILFEGAKSVMLADGWGVKNTAAVLTSHLNDLQLLFLIKLGVRVVFALDEEVDIRNDENIQKLKRYVRVDWVKNRDHLLSEKMSPVDAGVDIWKNLYERRMKMN